MRAGLDLPCGGSLRWRLIAGWLNHPVASVDYAYPPSARWCDTSFVFSGGAQTQCYLPIQRDQAEGSVHFHPITPLVAGRITHLPLLQIDTVSGGGAEGSRAPRLLIYLFGTSPKNAIRAAENDNRVKSPYVAVDEGASHGHASAAKLTRPGTCGGLPIGVGGKPCGPWVFDFATRQAYVRVSSNLSKAMVARIGRAIMQSQRS